MNKIKPLVWDMRIFEVHGLMCSKCSFGEYTVMLEANDDDTFKLSAIFQFVPIEWDGYESESERAFISAATKEDAMKACESHYERTVRACLSS